VAGTFNQRPIFETGVDQSFIWECGLFAVALAVVLSATLKLLKLRDVVSDPSSVGLHRVA
jgi:hypothetical protein